MTSKQTWRYERGVLLLCVTWLYVIVRFLIIVCYICACVDSPPQGQGTLADDEMDGR
jgi:hypothetical protein